MHKVTAHGDLQRALAGDDDLLDFIGTHIADRAASCGAALDAVSPLVAERVRDLRRLAHRILMRQLAVNAYLLEHADFANGDRRPDAPVVGATRLQQAIAASGHQFEGPSPRTLAEAPPKLTCLRCCQQ